MPGSSTATSSGSRTSAWPDRPPRIGSDHRSEHGSTHDHHVIVIVVLLVAVIGWAVITYNGLIKLRNLVQEAWRQIDVELTRRHDLIGNLVETVKGYAAHERGTLEDVVKARSAAMAPGQSPGRSRPRARTCSARRSAGCSRSSRPTPTSRPTRTSWPCRTS